MLRRCYLGFSLQICFCYNAAHCNHQHFYESTMLQYFKHSQCHIATLVESPLLLAMSLRNIRAIVFADSFQSDPSDTHQSTISQTLSSTILVLVPQGNVHCAMCLYILYRVISFLTDTPHDRKMSDKVNVIPIQHFRGCQSRDIFRRVPVYKITLYLT